MIITFSFGPQVFSSDLRSNQLIGGFLGPLAFLMYGSKGLFAFVIGFNSSFPLIAAPSFINKLWAWLLFIFGLMFWVFWGVAVASTGMWNTR